jgi:hypothetical protein
VETSRLPDLAQPALCAATPAWRSARRTMGSSAAPHESSPRSIRRDGAGGGEHAAGSEHGQHRLAECGGVPGGNQGEPLARAQAAGGSGLRAVVAADRGFTGPGPDPRSINRPRRRWRRTGSRSSPPGGGGRGSAPTA